jgi:hypothetical protein
MRQSCNTSGFSTQAEKIEALLRSRYGQWIPAYELADVALQYCARISSIRKHLRSAGDRERIENKTEWVNGQCHGSYRIVLTSDVLGITPAKPVQGKSFAEWDAERNAKPSEQVPAFELVP